MNNIQKMQVKAYKAMCRELNSNMETYGIEGLYVLTKRGRRESIRDIRDCCKKRLRKNRVVRCNTLYEAAKRERRFWER